MDWRDIPSLQALRAFEAAARHGSFSSAARELNVTHAAIAQHVRSVEEHLNQSLLNRAGRGLKLTENGVQLAAQLTDGFSQIIAGVRSITEAAEAKPLSVTVTPTFAENWLMPRLGRFWQAHPEIAVSITPSMGLSDLRRDGFDLGIRYGYGSWPGVQATFLAPADYVVVGTPELIGDRSVQSFEDLQDLPWLFEPMHREQRRWAEESGLDLRCCQINELATGSMVLSAVRSGVGITVASRVIVEQDIAMGSLLPVLEAEREGLGYYIITQSIVLSPRVKTFIRWLKGQVENPGHGQNGHVGKIVDQ